MNSNAPEPKSNPLRIFTLAVMIAGSAGLSLYAMSNLQTDLNLTIAHVAGKLPYDMEPDGTSVYRFGRNGHYSVTCQGSTPLAWDLPAGRDAADVDHICVNIEKQQAEKSE